MPDSSLFETTAEIAVAFAGSFLPLVSNGLGAVALLSLLGNACAWPWTPSAGAHLLAVWLTIAIVAIHFVVLIVERVLVAPLPDTPSQPTGR